MDLCIVINTCKHYFKNIESLVNQIYCIKKNNLLPKENIIIVSGQEEEKGEFNMRGIKIIKVKYTGFHLTGAIYIYENIHFYRNKFKYFLFLQDTIRLGNNFFELLMEVYHSKVKNSLYLSFPLISPSIRPTMDLGILHCFIVECLGNFFEIIKLRPPYSKDDLKNLKTKLIHCENMFLGYSNDNPFNKNLICPFHYHIYNYIYPITTNKKDLIEKRNFENGKEINQVYFTLLDLYKFQRNFMGLEREVVMEL